MPQSFATKTRCNHKLQQRDQAFEWTDECQLELQSWVDKITSRLLLQLHSLDKELTLTTEASNKTVGRILT